MLITQGLTAKLKKVTEWIRKERCRKPLKEIWKTFAAKLRGHVNYYGVSHNAKKVSKFIDEASCIVFKWLNRRSQRKSFTWEGYEKYMKTHPLPKVRIVHKLF